MSKRKKTAQPAPEGVDPRVWALAKRPPTSLDRLWRELGRPVRERLVETFFRDAQESNVHLCCERMNEFRGPFENQQDIAKFVIEGTAVPDAMILNCLLQGSQADGKRTKFFPFAAATAFDDDGQPTAFDEDRLARSALATLAIGELENAIIHLLSVPFHSYKTQIPVREVLARLTREPLVRTMEQAEAALAELEEMEMREPMQRIGQSLSSLLADLEDLHSEPYKDLLADIEELDAPEDVPAIVERVQEYYNDVALEMEQAAAALRAGVPLPSKVARDAFAVASLHAALVASVSVEMEECDIAVPPEMSSTCGLAEVRKAADVWAEAEAKNEVIDVAIDTISCIERLQSSETAHAGEIRALKQQAQAVIETLNDVSDSADPLIEEINSGKHPLSLLVSALDRAASATKADLSGIGTELLPHFGAGLSFGVVLGQVTLAAEAEDEDAEEEEEVTETPVLEPSIRVQVEMIDEDETESEGPADARDVDLTTAVQVEILDEDDADSEEHAVASAEDQTPVADAVVVEEVGNDAQAGGPSETAPSDEVAPAVQVEADMGETHDAPVSDGAVDLAYELVAHGERALAYHALATSTGSLRLPAAALRALALAPHLRTTTGEIAQDLRTIFGDLDPSALATESDAETQGVAMLLTAATLRPALLAPMTLAPHALSTIRFGTRQDELYRYTQAMAEHVVAGNPIDPYVLARVRSQAEWEREMDALAAEARDWLTRVSKKTALFPAATAVWQAWTREGGALATLLAPVTTKNADKIAVLEENLREVTDPDRFRRLVDTTDREVNERVKGGQIQYRAFQQLQGNASEAVAIATRWVSLARVAPGSARTYRVEQADRVRREVIERHARVRAEIDAIESAAGQEAAVAAGARALREALDDLEHLFSDQVETEAEPSPLRVLNERLLALPGVFIGRDWRPLDESRDTISAALRARHAAGALPTTRQVFEERSTAHDHVASELLLARLAEEGASESELATLADRRQHQIGAALRTMRRLVAEAEREIEQALMHGRLGEAERTRYMNEVQRAEQASADGENFARLEGRLDAVMQELRSEKDARVATARERLASLDIPAPAKARIERVLAEGDVLTAEEYMSADGGQVPEIVATDGGRFEAFFPEGLAALSLAMPKTFGETASRIRQGRDIGPLRFSVQSEAQTAHAALAVEAWERLRSRPAAPSSEQFRLLFDFLGFTRVAIGDVKAIGRHRSDITFLTDPVQEGSRCPLPAYGSQAAGDMSTRNPRARYRAVLIWDEMAPEDLVAALPTREHEPPTWVLYFGQMGVEQRRALARESRMSRRTFLVIDDLLMTFLAGETASRMATLFRTTAPFTWAQPFNTTIVPPEMFYGRDAELASVMDRNGTSIIFGGRQLGKTALLRRAERTFHKPDAGRIATYVDLKAEGIGIIRPADDVWVKIAEELKKAEVIEAALPLHASAERIIEAVRGWLAADANRRVLLLLDEADRFIEADSEFARVARLKGLMDQTDRRFKVVFAGLHNVQRMTRLSNNPLAHLGAPICIGPLVENGEWRAARDLIERPLEVLGYRFESPDLVTRIVSQTNYYPSLIQLFGVELLAHLSRNDVELFDSRTTPPYVVSARHVEDAYRSAEFRSQIRQRFQWTLDLDSRYRVFAQIIAYRALKDDRVAREGLTAQSILAEAKEIWPKGFGVDATVSLARALLDEMVGLGILRQNERDGYLLKNANVMLLMGNQEEIEIALLEQAEQESTPVYDPATYRRPLRAGSRRYSPLSAAQEGSLSEAENGVVVIAGTPAAGLSEIGDVLPMVAGGEYYLPLGEVSSRTEFAEAMSDLRRRRKDGVTLIHVPTSVPWDVRWLQDAASRLQALRSKTGFARVIFEADPVRAWSLTDPGARRVMETLPGLSTLTLEPWKAPALRVWLDDQGVPESLRAEVLDALLRITGGWPALLYQAERLLRAQLPTRWCGILLDFERSLQEGGYGEFGDQFAPAALSPVSVLTLFATLSPASISDVALVTGIDTGTVERAVQWGEMLSLVRGQDEAHWATDPVATRARFAGEPVLVGASGS